MFEAMKDVAARGRPGSRPALAGALLLTAALAGCSSGSSSTTSDAPSSASAPTASTAVAPTPSVDRGPSVKPTAKPSPTAPARPHYVFPVKAKTHFGPYHHDYPAVDIFAPCGSTAVSPVNGTVDAVSRTDTWHSTTDKGADRGGLSVAVVGTDGVRYYGSHLRFISADITPGRTVRAGQEIGHVGNTGDARGIACHLHFGISPGCGTADWWNRRGVVSPYRFLKAWQAGKNTSPIAAVKAWKARHGCPKGPTTDP